MFPLILLFTFPANGAEIKVGLLRQNIAQIIRMIAVQGQNYMTFSLIACFDRIWSKLFLRRHLENSDTAILSQFFSTLKTRTVLGKSGIVCKNALKVLRGI